jgi:PAS domain S-box-containing protein
MANGAVYWIGVLKKVQAKVTEKSLIQQEREVLDTLSVPAIIIDEKGNIHGFNKSAVKFFGYELVDVLIRNVSMLMPSPYAENHNQYINSYLSTGKAKIIGTGRKVVAQLKDGSIRPVFLTVTEKQEKDKRFFTGILQDAGV